MTATLRSTESIAVGAPLKLACELGSTTWTLGFTTAPARAPTGADDRRRGSRGAGEGAADRQGAVRAASRRGGAELLRGRAGWRLAAPVVGGAGRGARGGGVVEHRSEPSGAAGEDGPAGRGHVARAAPAVGRRGTPGVERGPRAVGGGGRAATAHARGRHRARGSQHEWAHLDAVEARVAAWTAARDEHIATGTDRGATVARQLCRLRAVAETSAAVFSAELCGTRTFSPGRPLGARLG